MACTCSLHYNTSFNVGNKYCYVISSHYKLNKQSIIMFCSCNISQCEEELRHPGAESPSQGALEEVYEPWEEIQVEEENQLKPLICALLQASDEYELQKTTKFLALTYCLRFLSHFPSFQNSNQELLVISSLRLAVKFHENYQVSSAYTVDCCVAQAQYKYTPEEFVEFETLLVQKLQYKLTATSPYQYLEEMGDKMGLEPSDFSLIQAAIDLALSMVDSFEISGEEIFACCLIACLEGRHPKNIKIFNTLYIFNLKYPEIREKALRVREEIFAMDEEIDETLSNIY